MRIIGNGNDHPSAPGLRATFCPEFQLEKMLSIKVATRQQNVWMLDGKVATDQKNVWTPSVKVATGQKNVWMLGVKVVTGQKNV